MLQAFLGLDPDVPNGVVRLRPSTAVGALRISGLRVGGAPFEISIGTSGEVESVSAAAGATVDSSAVPQGAASPRR
jgi:hypothetical protein